MLSSSAWLHRLDEAKLRNVKHAGPPGTTHNCRRAAITVLSSHEPREARAEHDVAALARRLLAALGERVVGNVGDVMSIVGEISNGAAARVKV